MSESEPIELTVGDTILMYTDGITEAFNPDGEWWGEDAMAQSLLLAHDKVSSSCY